MGRILFFSLDAGFPAGYCRLFSNIMPNIRHCLPESGYPAQPCILFGSVGPVAVNYFEGAPVENLHLVEHPARGPYQLPQPEMLAKINKLAWGPYSA